MKTILNKYVIKLIYIVISLLFIFTNVNDVNINNTFSLNNYTEQITLEKQNNITQSNELNNLRGITNKQIFLNEKNTVSLLAGEVMCFTYTPEIDFYYVVETYGTFDTKIKVSNTYNGIIIDDDSGTKLNAKVEFKGVQGQTVYIETKLYNANISGDYSIQLRKQRISMFAYDDSDGNSTIPDLNLPYIKFSSMFEAIKYENESAGDALSIDDRFLPKINSEIMFFSGHGYKNSSTEMGFGVVFKTGGITTNTSINLDRTKVAMWAACYSANSTNNSNISIAEYSVKNGARSAVGFTKSVSFSSSKVFTDSFFTRLSEGRTVKEAANYGANSLIWPWDNGKKYVIFGEDSLRVTDSTPSMSIFNSKKVNIDNFSVLNNNMIVSDLEQNIKRYYEQINGLLTNSFVDVTYGDDNKIVEIKDYRKNFTRINSINNKLINQNLSKTIIINDDVYNFDRELSRNIVYVALNNIMTPIEIVTGTYVNNGIVIEETNCFNLTNGQKIDYSEINSV